jgi:hypothetical protein
VAVTEKTAAEMAAYESSAAGDADVHTLFFVLPEPRMPDPL